jgi:hypothetical protein
MAAAVGCSVGEILDGLKTAEQQAEMRAEKRRKGK